MLRKKGFTLVEMMVVVLIVAILATAAVPILRGQIDSAKWSEGKAMMGTIATAIQSYLALTDSKAPGDKDDYTYDKLGFVDTDFDGKYFHKGLFDWDVYYDTGSKRMTYLIHAYTYGTGISYPVEVTLDSSGNWIEM